MVYCSMGSGSFGSSMVDMGSSNSMVYSNKVYRSKPQIGNVALLLVVKIERRYFVQVVQKIQLLEKPIKKQRVSRARE